MGGWLSVFFTPSAKIVSIRNRKYIIEKQIGEGGFSFVYLVRDPWTKEKFAVKKTLCQTEELVEASNKEVSILRDYKHPNLLHLIDFEVKKTLTGQETLILMNLYENGTIQSQVDAKRKQPRETFFTEKEVLTMFLSACKGLREFHRREPPLAHNDIKPGNMLLGKGFETILFDFGSVTNARKNISSRKEALALQEWADSNMTAMYKAPELFDVQSDAQIDERTDIWSLGCSLYTIAFNRSPFETAAISGSIALAVASGKIDIPQDAEKRLSTGFLDLLLSMLNHKASKRPFIDEVIERTTQLLSKSADDVRLDMK